MLSIPALASALPVVANLEARGLIVKPMAGSAIDSLFRASYADPELALPNGFLADVGQPSAGNPNDKYQVDIGILAQQTNMPSTVTGYCEQDICLNEIKGAVVTAVMAHLSYARTVVKPTIESFVEQLQEPLGKALADAIGGMEIVVYKLPAPMLQAGVVDAFTKSKDVPVEEFAFNLTLPQLDDEAILALMKSGAPGIDQSIDDWVEELDDGFLQKVWTNVFTMSPGLASSKPPSTSSVFTRSMDGLNAALMTFLVTRRIWNKPIDDVGMTLDSYQDRMAYLRDQAAVRLVAEVSTQDRNEKYATLVRSHERNSIIVNDVVYRKFLSDGGSNEVLLGNAMKSQPVMGAKEIHESKDECLKVWQNFLAYNRTSLANKRFTTAKALMRMEFSSFVTRASQEELPLQDRMNVMQRFDAALDKTTQDETMDLVGWVQRLLCSSLYYRSDAGIILDSINRIVRDNPEIDVREAAAVAAIDYTATWVGRQLLVLPARM